MEIGWVGCIVFLMLAPLVGIRCALAESRCKTRECNRAKLWAPRQWR